jgi:hypothetical protein
MHVTQIHTTNLNRLSQAPGLQKKLPIGHRTIKFDIYLSMNHSMILYSNCQHSNDVLNVRMAVIWTEQFN